MAKASGFLAGNTFTLSIQTAAGEHSPVIPIVRFVKKQSRTVMIACSLRQLTPAAGRQIKKYLRGGDPLRKAVKFKIILEGETMSQETINFSIVVNPSTPPPPALEVVDANGNPLQDGSSVTLAAETVGVADPGQTLFTVSGGVPPYTYSLASGSIPPGDELSSTQNSDGSESVILSGTPTAAGSDSFAITVTDSAGQSATIGTGSAAAAARAKRIATK